MEAPTTSNVGRLLWMILGGGVVAVVVWTSAGMAGVQWPVLFAEAKVAAVPPVVAVAPIAPVVATVAALAVAEPVPAVPAAPAIPAAPAKPAVPAVAAPIPAQPLAALPVAAESRGASGPVAKPPEAAPVLAWQSPAWLRNAGSLMSRGDRTGALQSWSQGLAKLSAKEALIVLPPSASDNAALSLYRSLSGQFPVLLAQDNGSLRVLLVPDVGEVNEVLADLRTQLKRRALRATTVAAWRAEPEVAKLAPPAAVVRVPSGAVTMPAQAAVAVSEPDSAGSAQGMAKSSAAEIVRRFNEVERVLSQGQFEAVMNSVAQLEAELGETWQASYLKGMAAQGLRRWDDAIVALTRAHQLNPASIKVLLNRAICLQELGKHEAALADLRQATVLSPNTPELVANSAYSLDALGRPAEALVQYQKFLEMTAGRDEYVKLRAWASKRVAR
jgi:tetratricopeptide (TPR) repeat protein